MRLYFVTVLTLQRLTLVMCQDMPSDGYKTEENVNFRLQDRLLKDYKKHIRPVLHPSWPLTINVTGSLYQVINVDQTKNLIRISAYFELSWKDYFLRWDANKFGNASLIYLPSEALWIPELYLYYSVDDSMLIQSGLNAEVRSDGNVRYFLPFTANTLCPINVKYFPFDEQKCDLMFGAWSHTMDAVIFSPTTSEINLADFWDNQEWQLNHSYLVAHHFTYKTERGEEKYSSVRLHILIKRQAFYYIFNLVLPSALITIVALIGFHFPNGSREGRGSKFRLGIMTLLSMAVLLLSVVTDMPKFSAYAQEGRRGSFSSVPLIGIYYFTLLAVVGLGTVTSSCFVIIEKYAMKYHTPVPPWLAWLLWTPSFRWCSKKRRHESIPLLKCNGRRPNGLSSFGLNSCPALSSNHVAVLANTVHSPSISSCEVNPASKNNTDAHSMQSDGSSLDLTLRAATNTVISDLYTLVKQLRSEVRKSLTVDSLTMSKNLAAWLDLLQRFEIVSLILYLIFIFCVLWLFFHHDWY